MPENCCVCGKFVRTNDEWVCELCGDIHHPECSGYSGGCHCTESCGEDDTDSICKKCVKGFGSKQKQ